MEAVIIGGAILGGQAIVSHQQKKAASEATKAAERQTEKELAFKKQQLQAELQAGEYFEELNVKQMELQSQASNINTLANLIVSRKEQQPATQIYTIPAAKTYTPVEKINQAIHQLLTGG